MWYVKTRVQDMSTIDYGFIRG